MVELKIELNIGPEYHTRRYVVLETSAPKAYDGFGTLELKDLGKTRVVAVFTLHQEWQVLRYQSGNHSANLEFIDEENVDFFSELLLSKVFSS